MRSATTAALALTCGLLAAARCDHQMDVTPWDKPELRLPANESYAPADNLEFRLRVWADTAYVAVPRFRRGVPATLCSTPVDGDGGPLRPYPSLGLQTPGNCIGLQNAVDIELDHLGQLWALDRGRAAGEGAGCDPKLFVVHTGTGRVVRSAVMPPDVYSDGSVLSGLVIDLKSMTAVVADVGPDDPGFVTYDFRSGIYRKFRCAVLARPRPQHWRRRRRTPIGPRPAAADPDAVAYDDDDYDEATLAASPIDDQLYFTAVGLRAVYAIPLSVFAAPPLYGRDVSHYASARGPVNGTATAAVMDTEGTLYVAVRPGRRVVAWNTLRGGFDAAEPAVRDDRLDWVSGLALDARGYLWIVTSAFREFARAGAAADARIFRRHCGATAFALQDAAVKLAADEAAAAAGRGDRSDAAGAPGPPAVLCGCCAAVAVLLRTVIACKP